MNIETNLSHYLDAAVKRLVSGVAAKAFQSPRQAAFLAHFVGSVRRAAEIRDQNKQKGVHVPVFLIASIAGSCNLTCQGCYARANGACGNKDTQNTMTTAQWDGVFAQAGELGIPFILLAGGEPLLEMDVIRAAASHQNIVFPVFTNGTLLKQNIELFDQHRNLIPILSIEGDQVATDARRGEGVYSAVLEALNAMKQRRLLYGTSVTVTRENRDEVTSSAFLDTLERSGGKLVFYVEYVPADGKSHALAPTRADRDVMEQRLAQLRQQYDSLLFLSFPGDEQKLGGCLAAGRGFFHINPHGDAEPCPFSPYSMQNLRESSLRDVLSSPFFEKVRAIEKSFNGEQLGGCVLFQQQAQMEEFMRDAAAF